MPGSRPSGESYPHIPQKLLRYESSRLTEALQTQGEHRTWQAIDALFSIGSNIVGMNSDSLLERLGFDEKNVDSNNLQSMFGVVRAITVLHKLRFVDIQPLPPSRERKEADLIAVLNGQQFAAEVFRSNETTWRYPGHSNPSHNLERYIASRYINEKRHQIAATMTTHRCNKALLAVVFDSPSTALLSQAELLEAIQNAFGLMGSPERTHILIFTGFLDVATRDDERAIYPPL